MCRLYLRKIKPVLLEIVVFAVLYNERVFKGRREMRSMDDGQIIELYWERKESAVQETNNKYGSYCLKIANQILSNRQDSEECVNDTWLRAWNSIPPKRPDKLRFFLAKITRNLSFDRYKARKAGKRGGSEIDLVLEELEDCLSASGDVETEISMKELEKSMNCFITALPERERGIFLRRYFYAESVSDIAERYFLKESNVLMILSRTRKKLKNYLIKEGYII